MDLVSENDALPLPDVEVDEELGNQKKLCGKFSIFQRVESLSLRLSAHVLDSLDAHNTQNRT